MKILLVFVAVLGFTNAAMKYGMKDHTRLSKEMADVAEASQGRERDIATGKIERCVGGNDCCTQSNQCGLGEGDCDTDNDCLGGLVCVEDNCKDLLQKFKADNPAALAVVGELEFSDSDDCCWFRKELAEYTAHVNKNRKRM